jgi:hypothetical protein
MADLGAETWIMHGTLLAWWWNQKVGTPVPWFMKQATWEDNANSRPDFPMGQRPRRSGYRADNTFPR